jgi:peptide/nickel transport system ATP-binding protein
LTADREQGGLSVRDLEVTLGGTRILNGVSFDVPTGTAMGLVGESGSGKSTIAKTIVGIHRPSAGTILFQGDDVTGRRRDARGRRRRIQLIPQDPYSSLDPRRTIGQTLAEAIDPVGASVRRHRSAIGEALELVSLPSDAASRHPHEFSGGQRQRIAIARALVTEPELVIADEITSALDLSTQAEILRLFDRLRHELRLTVLFISHDLAVVNQVSDTVGVLFHGDLVESGPVATVFQRPEAPYTAQLLASVPGSPGFTLD